MLQECSAAGVAGAGLRLGLLASFTPSIAPLAEEFSAMSAARGSGAVLQTAVRAMRAVVK